MRHKFADDVNVNVTVSFDEPTAQELEDLVDKVVEGTVVIIAAVTAAHILKRWLT